MDNFNPGTFDRKVSWQTVTTTKTGMGSPSKSYTHSFYSYMSREAGSGNQEQAIMSRGSFPFRFMYRGHYRSSMSESLIIVDETIKYNVLAVNPVKNKMFVEVLVEKMVE